MEGSSSSFSRHRRRRRRFLGRPFPRPLSISKPSNYDDVLKMLRAEGTSSNISAPDPNLLPPPHPFSPAPPDPSEVKKKYDVFLSFRGEDTRNNFTAHLYAALTQKGIYTFLDDCKLERGKTISPELVKAIEGSICSVIILSRNFASSTWCLDELVKILDCMKTRGQIVLPIFYHVDPTHVRKQTETFGEAFAKHEQDFRDSMERVQLWRAALTEVANLAGWHLPFDRDEAKFIREFVAEIISSKLNVEMLNVSEDLVGMDSRLLKLNSYVCTSSDDVCMIGICGMGGIGKTTIARAYYDWMSSRFEGSSFLANVREVSEKQGLSSLQKQLLQEVLKERYDDIGYVDVGAYLIRTRLIHKKTLVVIDDVDQLEQLRKLAGKSDWFGSGSRIIITTRDESLLVGHGVKIVYKMEELNDDESLQLFTWNAFKNVCPSSDYARLSEQVIRYANGLPLALEVLGSFLCGKSVTEWENALKRLREYPKKEIIKALQISFDGLEETEKNIFLDVACFFKGQDKDYVMRVLDSCGFYPEIGIRVLIDKSLLSIKDNTLWMHDLIQEMGWQIVREKSHKEPGSRSRLWKVQDLIHVLENNTGSEEVEAIVVTDFQLPQQTKKLISCEALSKLKKLRLLILEKLNFLPDLEDLSNELQFLDWHGYPLKCLPSNFQPAGLVELHLANCCMEHLWNGRVKPLYNLKVIRLHCCYNLIKIVEDFRVVPNLEKLILYSCTELLEVHPSITTLERLVVLALTFSDKLKNIPSCIKGLKSLKVLNVFGCSKLCEFPEDLGCLRSLEELDASGTAITHLPDSIVLLKNLRKLSFSKWRGPEWQNMFSDRIGKGLLPGLLSGLYSLTHLDLNNCNLGEGQIPEEIGCLVSLEELNLSNNNFVTLPASISQLSMLRFLHLECCQWLRSLGSELPSSLEMVKTSYCTSLNTFLDPMSECNLRCSAVCLECMELVDRQGSELTAIASLKRYLQNPPHPCDMFQIILPGNQIPKWFKHQNKWSSISIELEPNLCSSRWLGFAICAYIAADASPHFGCGVTINGNYWTHGTVPLPGTPVNSNHLWLFYLPRDKYFLTECKNTRYHIVFTFDPYRFGYKGFIVKGCGVRLVCEKDVQEFNEAMTNDCYMNVDG